MTTQPSLEEMLGDDPAVSSPASGRQAGPPVVSAVPAGGQPFAIVGDAYEGASKTSKELASWGAEVGSADAAILPGKETADARVNDIMRNDGYIADGRTIHQDSIVGTQFLLNASPSSVAIFGKRDEVWEEEAQEELEAKFKLYAESEDCWVDATRTHTLTGLVRLAVGIYLAGGEFVSSAEWLRERGRSYRTAVKIIETERLSDPQDRLYPPSVVIKGGVEKDRRGAPIAYHIRQAAIDDWSNPLHAKWKRVARWKPWGRAMMLHLFDQHRAEQSRGISQMVAALKEMRMTKEFRSLNLQNAIVQATYAASIESDLPPEAAFQAIGAGSENPLNDVLASHMAAITDYASGAKNLKMGGVKIPHLLPGTKLQVRPTGKGGPLGTEFEQSLLRYIASALGISYEQLSKDYTKTNYSSFKAGALETFKRMQGRKKFVADRFASFVYRLWFEEALNKGELQAFNRPGMPSFYEGTNKDAFCECSWIGAGRGQVDEMKETQAAILRIQNNLSTEEHEIARLNGGDWRKVKRQRLREQKTDASLGLEKAGMSSEMENSLTATPNNGDGSDGE